jgi:hypothetical protein
VVAELAEHGVCQFWDHPAGVSGLELPSCWEGPATGRIGRRAGYLGVDASVLDVLEIGVHSIIGDADRPRVRPDEVVVERREALAARGAKALNVAGNYRNHGRRI